MPAQLGWGSALFNSRPSRCLFLDHPVMRRWVVFAICGCVAQRNLMRTDSRPPPTTACRARVGHPWASGNSAVPRGSSFLCFCRPLRGIFAVLLLCSFPAGQASAEPVQVLTQTSPGAIRLELFADQAPITVANFLRYVASKHLDGAFFYRTVTTENDKGSPNIEVIQGGIVGAEAPFPQRSSTDQLRCFRLGVRKRA